MATKLQVPLLTEYGGSLSLSTASDVCTKLSSLGKKPSNFCPSHKTVNPTPGKLRGGDRNHPLWSPDSHQFHGTSFNYLSSFTANSSARSIVQCFLDWEPLLADCQWRHCLLNHVNEDVISSDSGCFIALKIILGTASRVGLCLHLTSKHITFPFLTGILLMRRGAGTCAGASCVSEPEKGWHIYRQRLSFPWEAVVRRACHSGAAANSTFPCMYFSPNFPQGKGESGYARTACRTEIAHLSSSVAVRWSHLALSLLSASTYSVLVRRRPIGQISLYSCTLY